ncbi:hypothetical protein KI387_040476, partial [Taxus chinensis]
ISEQAVAKYEKEVYFITDIDYTFIWPTVLCTQHIPPLPYEASDELVATSVEAIRSLPVNSTKAKLPNFDE